MKPKLVFQKLCAIYASSKIFSNCSFFAYKSLLLVPVLTNAEFHHYDVDVCVCALIESKFAYSAQRYTNQSYFISSCLCHMTTSAAVCVVNGETVIFLACVISQKFAFYSRAGLLRPYYRDINVYTRAHLLTTSATKGIWVSRSSSPWWVNRCAPHSLNLFYERALSQINKPIRLMI